MSKFDAKKIAIRSKALQLFNMEGLDLITMREIAAANDMLVGNITYYYPTKDDIILDLVKDLANENSQLISDVQVNSFGDCAQLYAAMFENHYQYRCLIRGQVMVNQQYKKVVAFYRENAKNRYRSAYEMLGNLICAGQIIQLSADTTKGLVQSIALVSRFWLQESWLNGWNPARKKVRMHYIALLLSIMEPYATTRGKKELNGLKLQYQFQE